MRSKYDKKNIKNQMQDMKLKKTRSNSIQLTNRGSFCNFAKPTHFEVKERENRGRRKIIIGA